MSRKLKIKVCGLKSAENKSRIIDLPIDFVGYIFYPPSKRYVGSLAENKLEELFSTQKNKVGVFVDEEFEKVIEIADKYALSLVQLHGTESPEYCQKIMVAGIKVIKAFRVDLAFNFESVRAYEGFIDYILFDTKAELPGGTGKKFNWQVLNNYQGSIPFFLSGGIGPDDVYSIKQIKHKMIYAIDLNSGFEIEPGFKDINKLSEFLTQLNSIQ